MTPMSVMEGVTESRCVEAKEKAMTRAPEWLKASLFRRVWPDHVSFEVLVEEMDAAMRFPGTTNAGTSCWFTRPSISFGARAAFQARSLLPARHNSNHRSRPPRHEQT